MNRAVEVLAAKVTRGRTTAAPLKELGEHPTEGGPVQVMAGRYGPYVKWGKVNATLPKDMEPETVTMEQAVALITEKAAKGGKKRASSTTKAKSSKPKAAAKPRKTAKPKGTSAK